MANLWALGDSFVYGEDVEINETFSYYIAQDLGLNLINLGRPGASNNFIVQNTCRQSIFYQKDDFILVALTTPHRNEHKFSYNKMRDFADTGRFTLNSLCKHIKKIEDCLEGFNYIITQAFNPVFGYDYKLEPYIEPKKFVEWGKPNNTIIDIISHNWLADNTHHLFMDENETLYRDKGTFRDNFAKNFKHPSAKGHRLVADKLLEYINYDNTNRRNK